MEINIIKTEKEYQNILKEIDNLLMLRSEGCKKCKINIRNEEINNNHGNKN